MRRITLFGLLLAALFVTALVTTKLVAASASISSGQTLTGSISESEPTDDFTFDAIAGDHVTILVARRGVPTIEDGFSPQVTLYDGSGNLIAQNRYGATDASIIAQAISADDTYRIEVKDSYGHYAGDYGVTLLINNGDYQNMDGGELAQEPVIYDGSVVVDDLTLGDMDGYLFWGNSGDTIVLTMTRLTSVDEDNPLNPQVQLHAPNGDVLENRLAASQAIIGSPNRFLLPTTGYYMIACREWHGNRDGEYELALDIDGNQPDQIIGGNGNDVYTDMATATTASGFAYNAQPASYPLTLQNDGVNSTAAEFVIYDDTALAYGGTIPSGWTITYYDAPSGGNDITTEVMGAGYSVNLDAGQSFDYRVEIVPDGTVAGNTSLDVFVEADSTSDATKFDIVKASTTKKLFKPDGIINGVGNDIYNTDATDQTVTKWTERGVAENYTIDIDQDGNFSDGYKITGTGFTTGWVVQYFIGTTDITTQVTGAGYTVGPFNPGAGVATLTMRVTSLTSAPYGSSKTSKVTITSTSDNACQDAVQAITYCRRSLTDLHVQRGPSGMYADYGGWFGNNTYNLTGVGQTVSAYTNNSVGVAVYINVQNDGNTVDSFTLSCNAGTFDGTTGWQVNIYNSDYSAYVTDSVVNGTYVIGPLAPGASQRVTAFVIPKGLTAPSSFQLNVTGTSVNKPTSQDLVSAIVYLRSNQPDGQIRYNTAGPLQGSDIYNTDGTNQTVTRYICGGNSQLYTFNVQNDGNTVDSFTVTAPLPPVTGFTAVYKNGATDITSDINGSGYAVGPLAPGASVTLTVTVSNDNTMSDGTQCLIPITITSVASTYGPSFNLSQDVVVADTWKDNYYQPDMWVRNSNEVTYAGNDIYNTSGLGQTKWRWVSPNKPATYMFRCQNDGNTVDSFYLHAEIEGSYFNYVPDGWTVRFFDGVTGEDISSYLLDYWSSGYYFGDVAIGASRAIFCQVIPDETVEGGESITVNVYGWSAIEESVDMAKIATSCNYVFQPDLIIGNDEDIFPFIDDFNRYPQGPSIGGTPLNPGTFTGENVYYPTAQSVNGTGVYMIQLQNDGNAEDTFRVYGTASNSAWNVEYYDMFTGDDVTDVVTDKPVGNYMTDPQWGYTITLPAMFESDIYGDDYNPAGARVLLVFVTPVGTPSTPFTINVIARSVSDLANKRDAVTAVTTYAPPAEMPNVAWTMAPPSTITIGNTASVAWQATGTFLPIAWVQYAEAGGDPINNPDGTFMGTNLGNGEFSTDVTVYDTVEYSFVAVVMTSNGPAYSPIATSSGIVED